MKIKYNHLFTSKLKSQLRYIAKDKLTAAKNFNIKIRERILQIPNRPFSYRKSIYAN
jgi:hypothetical protein